MWLALFGALVLDHSSRNRSTTCNHRLEGSGKSGETNRYKPAAIEKVFGFHADRWSHKTHTHTHTDTHTHREQAGQR